MVRMRRNPDGGGTEIPPERCPNGHELKYPNVIVAHGPKPGQRRAHPVLALPDLQGHYLRRLRRQPAPAW
jgi:hypothetical protein